MKKIIMLCLLVSLGFADYSVYASLGSRQRARL